ncbi:CHAT domain-containing protein [Flavobacterium gawalongense]|uniref:CHAT domain-containing protein n=1 Tax=Flavobacterium gawalongense TaxID=2594432 RepID=A0A553BDC2_9FLAO|nr:CHAT domain-containing tetratricopeptide repeat protein [Flavobacterium gawalongense]TRX01328.1 CHAT domain-containing protein [Flavobacterium gawalongense]TRX05852.1 CHAT domain-containing protein [Flavobacterium gawalongense]TRX06238.1 CHAT domain-containing protein [Flavobacterium gawalongense]TRX06982.1 CHAT domain-containing protein [Flavobacterium gawalongense]TRX23129.1 CHAT domain-containing protein [Flavobacterium gawalongense]
MTRIFFFLLLFSTLIVFGQKPLTQEDKIYNAVDAFVAHPSIDGLQNLTKIEKDFYKNPKPKSKNELLAMVVLNCNIAYYQNQFNQTHQAISSYEKAWQIHQKNKLQDYDIIEYCLKPLGNLYTVLGDYDNAENTIKQYYFIAEKEKNQLQKVAAILNLSNVYQSAGKADLAIDLLEKTIRTEKLSNTQKGNLLNNLGNNYVLSYKNTDITKPIRPNFFKNLEKSYLDAIQLLKSDKTQTETLANCYRNLSALNAQWHNFELANSYFEKAKKYFFETLNVTPRKIAKFKYEEALLLFQQQKLAESSTSISAVFKILIHNYSNKKSILPNQNLLYAETVLLDALDLQAEIFQKQNQPKKALETYKLSFHIEDLFANLLVYENSKIINQTRVRNRTEKCISIYDFLYQKEKKISYLENAFQLSERTKSGVLKSYLTQNKIISRKEKIHLEQLQNRNTEIIKEQQKGALADISKINEAIKKQNELMLSLKKIRLKNPKFIPENLDLNALFSKLEKDKAIMVYYFSGFEKMYYFTLENEQIKLNSFSNNAHSIVKIWQFLDYFSDANAITNNIKGYNQYGKIAFDLLKLPKNTIHKNLLIIPDGILNFLPFEALISKKSKTTNFAKMHYLLNDFRIAYNNSATFYLNAKPLSAEQQTVLGIFPVFEKTDYALTFSKTELQSIKKNFEGRFFENATATFDNFKRNASTYSILHLSTHASAGDIETPASIKFYDQEILYSELYNLKINPELVVLSACETGIGKLYKSEGAMSIARGFQFAGAQNLLFSLWKVNDYTTSVFMDNFYKNYKKSQSYFEANANTKLDFLKNKSIPNAKKSPYYWSAFVYYGELETKKNTVNYIFYSIGFLILIGLFLVFNRSRK